jgi:hypothetical protein
LRSVLDEEGDEDHRDENENRDRADDPEIAVVPIALRYLVDAGPGHDQDRRRGEELVDYEL